MKPLRGAAAAFGIAAFAITPAMADDKPGTHISPINRTLTDGRVVFSQASIAHACLSDGKMQIAVPVIVEIELGKPDRIALGPKRRQKLFDMINQRMAGMLKEMGNSPNAPTLLVSAQANLHFAQRMMDFTHGAAMALGLKGHGMAFTTVDRVILAEGCTPPNPAAYAQARGRFMEQLEKRQPAMSRESRFTPI